jgi:hypothetical protein
MFESLLGLSASLVLNKEKITLEIGKSNLTFSTPLSVKFHHKMEKQQIEIATIAYAPLYAYELLPHQ